MTAITPRCANSNEPIRAIRAGPRAYRALIVALPNYSWGDRSLTCTCKQHSGSTTEGSRRHCGSCPARVLSDWHPDYCELIKDDGTTGVGAVMLKNVNLGGH